MNSNKLSIFGIGIDAVDYATAVDRVITAAKNPEPFAVSALSVHGVMTGVMDKFHRHRLNQLDLLTPDGQPVRWLLNARYGTGLKDRVYGPRLTLLLLQAAAEEGLPVFFYGSQARVLEPLVRRMQERFPALRIAGAEPSKFRCVDAAEREQIARRIRDSGARLVFVGLGCPRQEIFAHEYRNLLGVPVIAVGAAFDYHAGLLDEPPEVFQKSGLQWAYRLAQEPGRLWKRYLLLNTGFMALAALQLCGLWHPKISNNDEIIPDISVA